MSFNDFASDASPPQYRRRESKAMSDDDDELDQRERPLPDGWIRQFDSNHSQYFYVDTRANPTRSIWVHPLDDPQWQQERTQRFTPPSHPPPRTSPSNSFTAVDEKGRSYSNEKDLGFLEREERSYPTQAIASSSGLSSTSRAQPSSKSGPGFLEKAAAGAMYVVETRMAYKERKRDAKNMRRDRGRHGLGARMQALDQPYLDPRRMNQPQAQSPSNPAVYNGYDPRYQGGPGYAYGGQQQMNGYGGGYGDGIRDRHGRSGLLGGLVGGLILGDIIGGDGGD
ncbi:hypothetical protein FRB96_006719 [Tulasnella sp. 330]|nr:hypothetical protein FRB96_006719 [Tulasnella sp. 330]KAG8868650.1 hypothetical protein FRB97_002113 [Tulasnella sp. 331]KAG8869902.1 hypothetical protein FRB98_002093 [Tulasnella sp. 332]